MMLKTKKINHVSFSEKKQIYECLKDCANLLQDPAILTYTGITKLDPVKWAGENLLGFALMKVRDELF